MQTTKPNFDCFNTDSNEFPVIFSFPHSGTFVPEDIRQTLKDEVLLTNSDWFLKELYSFIPELGFTTIQNNINYHVADPNDHHYNAILQNNAFGQSLYERSLNEEQIQQRVINFYQPYHDKLQQLIDDKLEVFDQIYLIDLHSFSHYPGFEMMSPADFVIGNDYDSTSPDKIKNWLINELKQRKYTVSDNFPFTGGHITKHYGSNDNIHTLHVEIRYNRYIDDREFKEEELTSYNIELFKAAQHDLRQITESFKTKLR